LLFVDSRALVGPSSVTLLRLFGLGWVAFGGSGGSIGRLLIFLSAWGRRDERFSLSEPNDAAGEDEGLRNSAFGVARFGQTETSVLGRRLFKRAMVGRVANGDGGRVAESLFEPRSKSKRVD